MKCRYSYIGIDNTGRHIRGRVKAVDMQDLHDKLIIDHIELIDAQPITTSNTLFYWIRHRSLTLNKLQNWCFQMHLLLKSGMTMVDAINFIIAQWLSPSLQHISENMLVKLQQGWSLSAVLQKYSDCFDGVFISIVQMGEKTGTLIQCLGHLLNYLEWRQKFQEQITRALIYPFILAVLTIIMISALFTVLIPEMQQFLIQQNQQLPLSTQLLIKTSSWCDRYALTALVCLCVAFFSIKIACRSSHKFRCCVDHVKLKFPKLGSLLYKIEAERFSYVLLTLYRSDIDIVDCLDHSCRSVKNVWLKSKLQMVKRRIESGELLSEALIAERVFDDFLTKVVAIGEKSGQLVDALDQASQFYLQSLQRYFNIIAAAIGPTFILILGLIMIWIASAIFMPLYDHLSIMI